MDKLELIREIEIKLDSFLDSIESDVASEAYAQGAIDICNYLLRIKDK